MKMIVHTGTGTVIDADDGVLVVDFPGDVDDLTDEDIVFYAMQHGVPFSLDGE